MCSLLRRVSFFFHLENAKECLGTMFSDGGDRFSGNQSAGSTTTQEEPYSFMEEMINMRQTCRGHFTAFQGLLMASLLTLNQEMTFLAMDFSAVSQHCRPSPPFGCMYSFVLYGLLLFFVCSVPSAQNVFNPPLCPPDAVLTLQGKCSISAPIQSPILCPTSDMFFFHFFQTP